MSGFLARRAFAHNTIATAIIALGAMGCAPSLSAASAASAASIPGVLGPSAPPPASFPLTRVVPLRIVAPVYCQGCTECAKSCRNTPAHQDVVESVQRANETFAPTGIQFSFSAVERVEAPTWWQHGVRDRKVTWAEIRADAQKIYPWIPDDAYRDAGETKATDIWLEVLTAAYARPEELTVFTQAGPGGNRGETHFPYEGRGMWVMDGLFGHGPGRGRHPVRDSLYLFGHELGHYFGLIHTFAHSGWSPVTQKPHRMADRWDLVYHPGSSAADPHVFFNNKEEAYRFSDKDLRMIEVLDNKTSNCREESDGAIECTLAGTGGYTETHRSGSPALKGHAFPLGAGAGRYRWARNALSYGDMEIPRRLSASQIEIVRTFLQYEMVVAPRQLSRYGRLPDDYPVLPSLRRMLGLTPSQPAAAPLGPSLLPPR